MMARGAGGAAAAPQDELGNWQQRCEDELEKIRTEGDLALIRVHAERQSIAAAEQELQALKKKLKDAKKHFNALSKSAAGATHHGIAHGAVVSVASGVSGIATVAMQHTAAIDHASAVAAVAPVIVSSDSTSALRVTQVEERLRVAVSERHVELQRLRQQVDQTRRQRLEGLQNEKRISDATRQTEVETQLAQREVEALKDRAAQLKRELAQRQSDFDIDKQAFRIERQRLTLEVARIAKPDMSSVKVMLPVRVRALLRVWYGLASSGLSHRRAWTWSDDRRASITASDSATSSHSASMYSTSCCVLWYGRADGHLLARLTVACRARRR